MAFKNRPPYRHSDFRKFICDDLAILCVNLVNLGPVTPVLKRVKGVHPSSISSLATFALLLNFAGISTEFFEYSVLFHLYARGRHCYAARATR